MDLQTPLELFSLEEKAAQVAGWPFRFGSQFSVKAEPHHRDTEVLEKIEKGFSP